MADGASGEPWRRTGEGLLVVVRLTPKSSGDVVEGIDAHGGRPVLKARVRAAPEKGKANTALERLMAKWTGIPKSRVSLASGATSRLKTIALAGDPDALIAILRQKTGADA